jgi:hypothetical protein
MFDTLNWTTSGTDVDKDQNRNDVSRYTIIMTAMKEVEVGIYPEYLQYLMYQVEVDFYKP